MVTVRKRHWTTKSGKKRSSWIADYFDADGKRRYKHFTLKKEANDWAAATRIDLRKGIHTPDWDSVTIAEMAEHLHRRKKIDGCRRSTLESFRYRIDKHIHRRAIGKVKLSQLQAADGEAFFEQVADEVSIPTAHKMLGILKEIVKYARQIGFVRQNVLEPMKRKPHVTRKMQIGREIPSKGDIRLLIDKAPAGWFRDILIVAAFTGMRCGELRALHWQDVDFENKVINICRNADRWSKTGKIGAPKTKASERRIPMGPIVFNTLQQCARAALQQPANDSNVVELPRRGKPAGLVFINHDRRPYNVPCSGVVWRTFQELQFELGIVGDPKRYAGTFGDEAIDRRAKTHERVMPMVRELLAAGISTHQIAHRLNAAGIPTQLGGRWHRRTVIELLRYDDGKLPKYSFHALRHFAASLFIERGFAPKRLQDIIGHKSIAMTLDIYGHLFPSEEDDYRRLTAAENAVFVVATSGD